MNYCPMSCSFPPELPDLKKSANGLVRMPRPIVRGRIAHLLSAYELTRLGVGITIYPASAGDIANLTDVCIKEIVEPSNTASYILIWNKYRQLSHVAEEFLNFIKEQ